MCNGENVRLRYASSTALPLCVCVCVLTHWAGMGFCGRERKRRQREIGVKNIQGEYSLLWASKTVDLLIWNF